MFWAPKFATKASSPNFPILGKSVILSAAHILTGESAHFKPVLNVFIMSVRPKTKNFVRSQLKRSEVRRGWEGLWTGK